MFEEMNNLHNSIKFTMNHTSPFNEAEVDQCQCEKQLSIPFLDVRCSIEKGEIELTFTGRIQTGICTSSLPPVTLHHVPRTFPSLCV